MLEYNSSGPYTDLWSLGIIAYQFLTGKFPFRNNFEMTDKVMEEEYKKNGVDFPEDIDEDSKDFVRGLLKTNPVERLGYGHDGYETLKKHPFLKDYPFDNEDEAFCPKIDLKVKEFVYQFKVKQIDKEELAMAKK